jgi:hypothetical protein
MSAAPTDHPARPRAAVLPGALAAAALAGVAGFAGAVVALHVLPTGLDPIGRTVSEYVNEPYGWLIPLAGASIGLGSVALTLALAQFLPTGRAHGSLPSPPRPRPGSGRSARAGLALLALWGGAMLVVAAFPADPAPPGRTIVLTAPGTVHIVAGAVAFLALAVAAPLIGRAVPRDGRLAAAVRALGLAAPAGLVVLAVTLVNQPPVSRLVDAPRAHGLGERVMVAVYVAWLLTAAAWAWRRSRGTH